MEHIDAKWHYPKMGEYPIKFGKYTQQNYPQIPCLVLYNGMYGVRFWNCTEECWDDEECDDFFCEKEAVEKWLYIDALDSLQQEHPEVYLDENTMKKEFRMIDSACLLFNYDKLSREQLIARRFYQLGLKARKEEEE